MNTKKQELRMKIPGSFLSGDSIRKTMKALKTKALGVRMTKKTE